MRKVTLNIEQLRVDSYATTCRDTSERGTVCGNSGAQACLTTYTMDFTCAGSTCGSPTNAVRCN
jgi:hypothetical protein